MDKVSKNKDKILASNKKYVRSEDDSVFKIIIDSNIDDYLEAQAEDLKDAIYVNSKEVKKLKQALKMIKRLKYTLKESKDSLTANERFELISNTLFHIASKCGAPWRRV